MNLHKQLSEINFDLKIEAGVKLKQQIADDLRAFVHKQLDGELALAVAEQLTQLFEGDE